MVFRWRDNSIKIVAFLMAVLLWVYVTNEQNPIISRTYQIPLAVQGEPEGYVTSGLPEKVSIRVKSPRNIGAALGVSDFSAKVNLLGIAEGNQQLPVLVTAPPGVEVLQIIPQVVGVLVDKVTQKNVSVTLNIKGEVAQGFLRGEPVLEPTVVTMHGPSKLLAEINKLGVSVDVTGVQDTLIEDVAVQTGVKGVTVSPVRVLVTVPVTLLPAVDLPVHVNLTGEPAEGYSVGQILVEPTYVQVTGPQQVIDTLTAVDSLDVDISGVTEDVEREVWLALPKGAISIQPEQVHIAVRIEPLEKESLPAPAEETGEENSENTNVQ